MKTTKAGLSRRSFILAVSAGTAASAAAIVAKKQSDAGTPAATGKESATGYQLTEHVQNYYRTAKI